MMSDISRPVELSGAYKVMLDALNQGHHFHYHVSRYTRYTSDYVLWHEEWCHHEYTWLSTALMEDMLMAIEYLYHHRIGGKQIDWQPKGWWLDKGYKALVNM